MKKNVAILGGSFNPPHPGHFEMARYIQDTLAVDEVWLMFSMNRFKDSAAYAPIEHRLAMADILAKHYPDTKLVMCDIEKELAAQNIDTQITYDVLKALKSRHPDTHFIWMMGADNVIDFHKWEHAEKLLHEFPVAIINRHPYTTAALLSETITKHQRMVLPETNELLTAEKGWHFLMDAPRLNLSSTDFMEKMKNGVRTFKGPLQKIATYITDHKLYGIDDGTPPSNTTPSKACRCTVPSI